MPVEAPEERAGARTRVFIVAQVKLYREGLAESLARRGPFVVAGSAATPDAACEGLRESGADVVLLDLAGVDGRGAVRSIAAVAPGAQVVALAMLEQESQVLALAEAGIASYVPREASLDDLVVAIEGAARGEARCSPAIVGSLLRRVAALAAERPAGDAAPLTSREREILSLVDEGLSNKEIARRLFIAPPTVKNHVHNILEKLQVTRRAEAAARVRGVR